MSCRALQRSRALSSAEIRRREQVSSSRAWASTEPRSFERGDSALGLSLYSVTRSFNGAALFRARRCFAANSSAPGVSQLQRSRALSSAEMTRMPAIEFAPVSGFNGAALFRARRCAFPLLRVFPISEASTEPRSFERGDSTTATASTVPALLQRSRALSSAEIASSFALCSIRDWLQRSRALSSAEISAPFVSQS